ncbi:MAG: outer membrane receptor for ferrienterochelin and colicins [Crocinitomix sp.]|jgi:outer membrane receptor for ferrienterochelin and colicins
MNKLIYILFFVCIQFQSVGLHAQDEIKDVVGKVTYKATGIDLSGVYVTVKTFESNFNDSTRTITDINGLFEIEAQKKDHIIFSHDNYEPQEVVIRNKTKLIIKLDTLIIVPPVIYADPFDERLSSAGKKDLPVSDIPASVVLVTKAEIEALGYQSVEEILINVPGLYGIEQQDWTGQGMNIGTRGFYSFGMNNEMVIMVNGVNMLEDHWSFYPLSRIEVPIESIERIEIVRGPMSVIYGSGAFLGSIDIITNNKSENPEKEGTISGSATAAMGLALDYRATAVVSGQSELGYHTFSAGINRFDGPNQLFDSISVIDNGLAKDMTTKGFFTGQRNFFNYSGNFGKVRLNISYSQANQRSIRGGFDNVQGYRESRLAGGNGQLKYTNFAGTDSILQIDAKIGYFSHKSFMDYSKGNAGVYDGFASFESSAIEGEVNGIWNLEKTKLGIPFEITTGLYYRMAFGLHTAYHLPPEDENNFYRLPAGTVKENYGLILNNFYQIRKNLSLVAGIRMEIIPPYELDKKLNYDYSLNDLGEITGWKTDTIIASSLSTVFIPRVGLIYKVNDQNIVKLLYGNGVKQPSFGQISDEGSLDASRLNSFEINYLNKFTKKNGEDYLWANETNISLFYNKIKGLIDRTSIQDPNTNEFNFISKNQGVINTFGAEFTNKFKLREELILSLSYTFQISENKTEYVAEINPDTQEIISKKFLENTAFSPVSLAYASLSWQPRDWLSIGTKFRYVGAMYSEFNTKLNVEGTVPGYDGILEQAEQYIIGDVQISYTNILDDKLRINFNVKNIFNKQFHYPYGSNTSWAEKGMMGRGRWFMLSVKYSF